MKRVCPTIEEGVCYTVEAALEMAIQMEEEGFRSYLFAVRLVKDRAAKMILKDAAIDELKHKQELELALLEGVDAGGDGLAREVPTMNLDYMLEQTEISQDADARQALAYSIHLEKNAIEFYKCLVNGCEGAPMAPVFQKLLADESKHLRELEDMYEKHFMTEN
ncbi:MAG: ferritin family protein [Desulfuromonadales bacterium]|nr:ferritin family protein [Desulfuromonadales bacterium]